MTRLIIFVSSSIALAYLSRSSLVHPRSHGFFRFFAWECIVALLLINSLRWFRAPLSLHQLASWFLLCVSVVPLLLGVRLLQAGGRPNSSRSGEVPLMGIEKTTQLVTSGVYGYIRHPLYCSLMLLAWGAFLKHFSWVGSGLVLAATVFLVVTAKVEETENIDYFGASYREYMEHTKMFIPFLF